jgi:1-acyl-sn-glycerol-3-phosphate acyltransferase
MPSASAAPTLHPGSVPLSHPQPSSSWGQLAHGLRNRALLLEQRLAELQPLHTMERQLGEARVRLTSLAKLAVGSAALVASGVVQGSLLLALLPNRRARIRACNHYGKVIGRFYMHLAGCPLSIEGQEHLDPKRPAIYVSNHSSVLDVFLAIWLSPVGTVGIAKKEVARIPVFGQLYFLSGHLLIDRGDSDQAVARLKKLARYVRENKLSIFLWPEGTRSRSGRLLPLKKGVAHLAIQTGLPVVPIVVEGAHRCWTKETLTIRPVPVRVRVLPPVDTSAWTLDGIDAALADLHGRFADNLPNDQKPDEAGIATTR